MSTLKTYQRPLLDMIKGTISGAHAFLPFRRMRLHDDDVFNWPDAGHDPYNHHGREMRNDPAPFCQRNYSLIILDDLETSYDPRNRFGQYA